MSSAKHTVQYKRSCTSKPERVTPPVSRIYEDVTRGGATGCIVLAQDIQLVFDFDHTGPLPDKDFNAKRYGRRVGEMVEELCGRALVEKLHTLDESQWLERGRGKFYYFEDCRPTPKGFKYSVHVRAGELAVSDLFQLGAIRSCMEKIAQTDEQYKELFDNKKFCLDGSITNKSSQALRLPLCSKTKEDAKAGHALRPIPNDYWSGPEITQEEYRNMMGCYPKKEYLLDEKTIFRHLKRKCSDEKEPKEKKRKRNRRIVYPEAVKKNGLTILSQLESTCARPRWLKIAWILRTLFHDEEERGLKEFTAWSRSGSNFVSDSDCKQQWDSQTKPFHGNNVIRSLSLLLPHSSPNGISQACLATLARRVCQGYLVVSETKSGSGWLYNTDTCIWEKSTYADLRNKMQEMVLQHLSEQTGVEPQIETMSNQVMAERVWKIAYTHMRDKKFQERINVEPSQEHLFPTRGCEIVNLRTLQVEERTQKHFFSCESPAALCFDAKTIESIRVELDAILSDPDTVLSTAVERAVYELMKKHFPDAVELFDSVMSRPHLTNYLQRYLGTTLTASNAQRLIMFFVGFTKNGKSEIFKALMNIECENEMIYPVDKSLVLKKKDSAGGHTSNLMKIRNARTAIMNELDQGDRLNGAAYKELADCEGKMQGREIYNADSQLTVHAKIILATQVLPHANMWDRALRKRTQVLQWRTYFYNPEEPEDKVLGETRVQNGQSDQALPERKEWLKRFQNDLMDQLFTFLAFGAYQYYRLESAYQGKVPTPQEVKDWTQEYFDQEDQMGQFLKEYCCEPDMSNPQVTFSTFSQYYNRYLKIMTNSRPLSMEIMRKSMLAHNIVWVDKSLFAKIPLAMSREGQDKLNDLARDDRFRDDRPPQDS